MCKFSEATKQKLGNAIVYIAKHTSSLSKTKLLKLLYLIRYIDDIPANRVLDFEADFYPFLEAKFPKIFEDIRAKKALDKDTEEELNNALKEFKTSFSA